MTQRPAEPILSEAKDSCSAYHDEVLEMFLFFFQAEDGIRDLTVTGVQTCALPICSARSSALTRVMCSASTARTKRSRKRRRSEAGPLNKPSMAGTSQTTRRWSAKADADATGSRSTRHLRAMTASSPAGGSIPVPKVASPSVPSTSADTAHD